MVKVKVKGKMRDPLEDVEEFVGVNLQTFEDYKKWDSHLNEALKSLAKYYSTEIDRRDKHPLLQAKLNSLMMCIQNIRVWMRQVAKVQFGQYIHLEKEFKLKEYLFKHMDHSVLAKMTKEDVENMSKRQDDALKKVECTLQLLHMYGRQMMEYFYKTLTCKIIDNIVEENLNRYPFGFF
jgi:hypothetical protein